MSPSTRDALSVLKPKTIGREKKPKKNPTGIRRELWEAGGCRCMWCGDALLLNHATIEHIIPRSKGGTNARHNLGIACGPCNWNRARADDPFDPQSVVAAAKAAAERRKSKSAKAVNMWFNDPANEVRYAKSLSAFQEAIRHISGHPASDL